MSDCPKTKCVIGLVEIPYEGSHLVYDDTFLLRNHTYSYDHFDYCPRCRRDVIGVLAKKIESIRTNAGVL